MLVSSWFLLTRLRPVRYPIRRRRSLASPIEFADFTSPAYKLESPNVASSQMINLYCEVVEKGPRTGKLRVGGIPGMKSFATLPDEPVRGLIGIDGGNRLFAVAGSTVYEVF